MPRPVTAIGKQLYPTPSASEFVQMLQADLQQAEQAGDYKEFMEAKKQELQQHNVSRVEDLTLNYAGFSLQAERSGETAQKATVTVSADPIKIVSKRRLGIPPSIAAT